MMTQDELKRLAALSKLSLEGEDVSALTEDISSLIRFADTIKEAPVGETPWEDGQEEYTRLREDTLRPSWPVDEILKNAGEKRDGYFVAQGRGGPSQ